MAKVQLSDEDYIRFLELTTKLSDEDYIRFLELTTIMYVHEVYGIPSEIAHQAGDVLDQINDNITGVDDITATDLVKIILRRHGVEV